MSGRGGVRRLRGQVFDIGRSVHAGNPGSWLSATWQFDSDNAERWLGAVSVSLTNWNFPAHGSDPVGAESSVTAR